MPFFFLVHHFALVSYETIQQMTGIYSVWASINRFGEVERAVN